MNPVDAILLLSFGGPEAPEDVMPFLRKVTTGRGVPDDRLAVVAKQYEIFGGRSPINDQNRSFIAALRKELDANDVNLPIYWGNRNWDPFIGDTMAQMAADGIKHAVAFVTSAFSSYSGCHQYKEDIAKAQIGVENAPTIVKVRQYFNHPGFIEPMVRNVEKALTSFSDQGAVHVAFTAHSIPTAQAETSRYQAQLEECGQLIAERLPTMNDWALVFQSRSGSPHVPWLEPDIADHLEDLHDKGVDDVVMVPIGFVSDHMEVKYDLDTLAMKKGEELGMHVVRASTVGDDPQFITAARQLIQEEIDAAPIREALGSMGVVGCQGETCCPPPERRPLATAL